MARALALALLMSVAGCHGQSSVVGPAVKIGRDSFPALTGRVTDAANLISKAEEGMLTNRLAELESETTDQVVVVTLPTLHGHPIEEVGRGLGNGWGIGQEGKNNGVLLIVAPIERKVRMEVGYGLEKALPNALCASFIDRDILPHFRQGNMEAGIAAGVSDIVGTLQSATRLRKAA